MNSPIKWHGGKHYLARKIVDLMPPHTHYVEPYAGSLAVLLARNPNGVSEVANDLDGRLTNFWDVLRSPGEHRELIRKLTVTPFSEVEWKLAKLWVETNSPTDSITKAFHFFVYCRQSLAGRMDSFAPLSRERTRRGMNEQVSAWLSAVEGLPEVHERMKRVVVYNSHALEVIAKEDGPSTLFYCDPPYVPESRVSKEAYGAFEMDSEDHERMLNKLANIKGKFMLSGYDNTMYDFFAKDKNWKRYDFNMPNNASGSKTKKRMTECLWCNF